MNLVENNYMRIFCFLLQKINFYNQSNSIIINVILESVLLQCDISSSDRGLATYAVCAKYSFIESDWRLCRQQGCIMKSMAVTYVHGMVHEMLAIKKK